MKIFYFITEQSRKLKICNHGFCLSAKNNCKEIHDCLQDPGVAISKYCSKEKKQAYPVQAMCSQICERNERIIPDNMLKHFRGTWASPWPVIVIDSFV
jgi:hypothetical protein